MVESERLVRLKEELQGDGLIKEVREKFLPDQKAMAENAQRIFREHNGPPEDVDAALEALLEIEYRDYGERELTLVDTFWREAPALTRDGRYPEFAETLSSFRVAVRESDDPATALNQVAGVYSMLVASNNQSRKSRSGASLMHHIAYLLQSAGFVQERDFLRERQVPPGSGCKLDFFFPSLEQFEREPKNCCAVACQTTSNDRFRLTFAQMPETTRNRACTAIGSKNFAKTLGPRSLTTGKLAEARSANIKFVVLGSAINDHLRSSGVVMSYTEWFDELRKLKNFW